MGRGHKESADPATCSERERVFVDALLGEAAGNQKRAAELAGYAGGKNGHAWSIRAGEMMNRGRVRALIEQRRAELAEIERLAREAERAQAVKAIAQERAKMLVGGVLNVHQLQQLWSRIALGEIEGFDGAQKLAASKLLAASHGAFNHVRHTRIELSSVDDDDLWAELETVRRERSLGPGLESGVIDVEPAEELDEAGGGDGA